MSKNVGSKENARMKKITLVTLEALYTDSFLEDIKNKEEDCMF